MQPSYYIYQGLTYRQTQNPVSICLYICMSQTAVEPISETSNEISFFFSYITFVNYIKIYAIDIDPVAQYVGHRTAMIITETNSFLTWNLGLHNKFNIVKLVIPEKTKDLFTWIFSTTLISPSTQIYTIISSLGNAGYSVSWWVIIKVCLYRCLNN